MRQSIPDAPRGIDPHARRDPAGEAGRAATIVYPATGGEMEALMRAKDWSQTRLGPRSTWPQSLKTALSIVMSSRFPMIIFWGPELCVLYNDAYIPIFANKHPDVLGKTGFEAWGEVWNVIGPMFDAVTKRGETTWSSDELLILRRKGFAEETYLTWSYSPITDESGGVGGVFTSVIETTPRVVGERRLKTLRELAEASSRAADVREAFALSSQIAGANVHDVPFGALYSATSDEVTLVASWGLPEGHPAAPIRSPLAGGAWPFAEALQLPDGCVVPDLEHQFPAVASGVWPDTVHTAVVLALPSSDSARPHGFLVAGTSPRLELDASYRQFLVMLAHHVGNNVSNAVAHEEERKRAEALAEIDRAKTAFFGNVSHEFRTPLTLMLGQTEDALRSPARTLEGQALESVHRNELRLLKLVNTLLDFARMEAGRARASFEPTDVAALTGDLASSFRSAIERAGLRFEVDCSPLGEPVFVDPEMWEKIVFNLLSNALKFTFEGSIGVRVRAEATAVVLEVSDTGVGIPAEELPRVFDRFHRVQGSRARSFEGSGIGLALVNELVKTHGGNVAVASVIGKGTTFTVTVPRGREHLPKDRVLSTSHAKSNGTASAAYVTEAARWMVNTTGSRGPARADDARAPRTILLADDNADMREYVTRLLSPRWAVRAVANGRQALAAARETPPDLVLTDVMMPELDGFGLLEQLRADPRTRPIPVIMLSARAGEEARVQGAEAGADDYLVKPFSARELVARVALHLQLAELRAEAEAERAKLQTIFRQAPFPIGVFEGPEHRIVLANEKWEALVGRSLPVGQRLAEAVPELREQGILDWHVRAFAGESIVARDVPLALVTNGVRSQHYFHVVLEPLTDDHGRRHGHVTMALDVTDQVLARDELDRARRGAEAASRTKDEFLAMLGHELRNPLSPMLTALQLLRLRGSASREQEVLERQVGHLTRLVDDLLDVSRITRGKVELRRGPVDLANVVARAVEMASPLLEQRRHDLELRALRGVVANVDADRMAQVVANLLTNAAKYSESASRIEVELAREGDRARIRVRDQGVGIEPAMLERIFDMFVQRPQTLERAQGGLGLGLAIVKSLVEMHDGTIAVRSDGVGKGSEFVVELPLLAGREATDTIAEPEPQRGVAVGRVLVVDDNVDSAEMLKEALEQLGYTVETAHDGLAALEVAERFVPDVALVDIGLPVMNGYELAPRLRAVHPHSKLGLVAVTGYGQEEDRRAAQNAGFDLHLIKPVDLQKLQEQLRSLRSGVSC